jgi:hypothetical protein
MNTIIALMFSSTQGVRMWWNFCVASAGDPGENLGRRQNFPFIALVRKKYSHELQQEKKMVQYPNFVGLDALTIYFIF